MLDGHLVFSIVSLGNHPHSDSTRIQIFIFISLLGQHPYSVSEHNSSWLTTRMSDTKDDTGPNSLGLDLQSLSISDDTTKNQATPDAEPKPSEADVNIESPSADQPDNDAAPDEKPTKGGPKRPANKDKISPYVNPDRVKTGGAQRVRPGRVSLPLTRTDPWYRKSLQMKNSQSEWRVSGSRMNALNSEERFVTY